MSPFQTSQTADPYPGSKAWESIGWLNGCMDVFSTRDRGCSCTETFLSMGRRPNDDIDREFPMTSDQISSRKIEERDERQMIQGETISQKRVNFAGKNHKIVIKYSNSTFLKEKKQDREDRQPTDKYRHCPREKPMEILEIQRSDSASEVTLPPVLETSLATTIFRFNQPYDDVTQPELERIPIFTSVSNNDTQQDSAPEKIIATERRMLMGSGREANQATVQQTQMTQSSKTPTTESQPKDSSRRERQHRPTTREEIPSDDDHVTSKPRVNRVKIHHNGLSEMREPHVPTEVIKTNSTTHFREQDERDDNHHVETEKKDEHQQEIRRNVVARPFDKYEPLREVLLESSRNESVLESKSMRNDDSLIVDKVGTNGIRLDKEKDARCGNSKDKDAIQPQPHGNNFQLKQSVSQGSKSQGQVFKQRKSESTSTGLVTLEGQGQKMQPVPFSTRIHSAMSVRIARRNHHKTETKTTVLPAKNNGRIRQPQGTTRPRDGHPVVSSDTTQLLPGTLRL